MNVIRWRSKGTGSEEGTCMRYLAGLVVQGCVLSTQLYRFKRVKVIQVISSPNLSVLDQL
jgi:hypothetical protein